MGKGAGQIGPIENVAVFCLLPAPFEVSMRPRPSQKVVNFLLPAVILYAAGYAVWSIIRPWTGY